jgi:hypothetical protein
VVVKERENTETISEEQNTRNQSLKGDGNRFLEDAPWQKWDRRPIGCSIILTLVWTAVLTEHIGPAIAVIS